MKTRFTTVDLVASVTELQRLLSLRVAQVYDVDHRTYIIKLQQSENKATLILESGNRIHTTAFDWPKNPAPSGFTMKLRKHIRNKRLESVKQLGVDRIVDLQFGSGEAACHIFLELYDRGNIVLTDFSYTILNILRPRTEGEDARFLVRETYPVERARQPREMLSAEELNKILISAKEGDSLKKVLNPHLDYGPAIIEHILLEVGFPPTCRIGMEFSIACDAGKILSALEVADKVMKDVKSTMQKGYVIQKLEKSRQSGGEEDFYSYQEFHPQLFHQHASQHRVEFDSFDKAVDEFFSKLEGQKIDMKAIHQEREAMKKLENVKKDHSKRMESLQQNQLEAQRTAQLIELNSDIVDRAILVVCRAIANQLDWKAIWEIIKEAQEQGDVVAKKIKGLKLEINHITMLLSDPYIEADLSGDEGRNKGQVLVDIDLGLTAYSNARKYYNQKRSAAKKEQKTMESADKAFKSAEKKRKQTLREVAAISSINKARKVHWFEKFYWFITSENYLVIGGRDQQQNELIVKRYMKPGDIYVHADLHGASTIVIRNPTGESVPPKSLNEAGVMAVCYSVAWEAKVVTSAWWVHSDQVSKTAPTGEYLTTGSFMVRGKKNYLPASHLIMGFGFLFKLDESSIFRHKNERIVRGLEDEVSSIADSLSTAAGDEEDDIAVDEEDSSQDSSEGESETEDLANSQEKQDELEEPGAENDVEKREENELEVENKKECAEDVDDVKCDDEKSSSSSDDDDGQFPDTKIAIEHLQGGQFRVRPQSVSSVASTSRLSQEQLSQHSEREQVAYFGDDEPFIIRAAAPKQKRGGQKNKGKKQEKQRMQIEDVEEEKSTEDSPQQMKRGKKGKMKKIKGKYKDQDEEERRLRMQLLQSAGVWKDDKKKKGKKGKPEPRSKVLDMCPPKQRESQPQLPVSQGSQATVAEGSSSEVSGKPEEVEKKKQVQDTGEAVEDEEEEEKEEKMMGGDLSVINSLTGIPVLEDELLFAVPVCAPYSCMGNYKFKVKLTPGMSRRGKAAKTSFNLFLQDRSTSSREKDLLRSVKDQDLARNLPGKVKLSAPQLQRLKHK